MTELLLWGGLALLISLLALAVFAGRRGLRSLGLVAAPQAERELTKKLDTLANELSRLNGNLEALIARDQERESRKPDDG